MVLLFMLYKAIGRTDENMKASGLMESNQAKERTQTQKER